MVEKPHVLHILNLLKDQYHHATSTADPTPARLPAYTTLHLAHSLRGIFYPSQFTYPLTARYLLQRPELDASDVPMLYATLYSAEEQWKRDRAWMVRFLGDGMVGREEWKVLRRRHTWDLVASSYQSTSDKAFRQGALKVRLFSPSPLPLWYSRTCVLIRNEQLLANITSKPYTLTQLVLKSSLLTWLETQLTEHDAKHPGEDLAYLKVMENVLVLADASKLSAATAGAWLLALGRCVAAILRRPCTCF